MSDMMSLILDLRLHRPSHHKEPKSHFSCRVTWQGDFCRLEEPAILELIIVDTVTSWHCQAELTLYRDCFNTPAPGGGIIGTETQCIIVIIVRGNLTLSLQKNGTAVAVGAGLGGQSSSQLLRLATCDGPGRREPPKADRRRWRRCCTQGGGWPPTPDLERNWVVPVHFLFVFWLNERRSRPRPGQRVACRWEAVD